jgi:predicted DNA-binding protein (MmcQ/YjbR family)
MDLGERTQALKVVLDALPGAVGEAMTASRGTLPLVLIYKVMGKMFAVLAVRGTENVILKCDPHLAEILREQYAGVGHRSHLDRRFWISVDLGADVPAEEIEGLARRSYDLVREGLTKKQQAALAAQTA